MTVSCLSEHLHFRFRFLPGCNLLLLLLLLPLASGGCLQRPENADQADDQPRKAEVESLRQQLSLFRTRYWNTLEGRSIPNLEIEGRIFEGASVKRVTLDGLQISHAGGMGTYPFQLLPASIREAFLLYGDSDFESFPTNAPPLRQAEILAQAAKARQEIQAEAEALDREETRAWRQSEIQELETLNRQYRAGIEAQKRMRNSLQNRFYEEDRRRAVSSITRKRGETKSIVTSTRDRQSALNAYEQKIGQLESLILANEHKILELQSQK